MNATRNRRMVTLAALVFSLALQGCGDETENSPPRWAEAPTEHVVLGQGRASTLDFRPSDSDGDAVSVRFELPAGVEATHDPATETLVIRAGYDVVGRVDLTVVLDDGVSPAVSYGVELDVSALEWTDKLSWSAAEQPEAREHGSVVVNDATQSVYVLFGSGYAPYLSALSDGARFDVLTREWSPLSFVGEVPDGGGSKRFAGPRGAGWGYLHGGYGDGGPVGPSTLHRVEVNGDVVSFSEVPQTETRPSDRALHVFAYDPGTDTFVLFGGSDGGGLRGDTWTMRVVDGVAQWALLDDGRNDAAPLRRYGAFYGMDEARGRLVLFSGQTGGTRFGDDVWIFDFRSDPPGWTEIPMDFAPPGRRNGTSVWDPVGEQLFVVGGTSDGMTTQPGLFALDARPGAERFTEVRLEGGPPLRSSGFGAFVAGKGPLGGEVWMGFGNSSSGVFRDFSRLGFTPR